MISYLVTAFLLISPLYFVYKPPKLLIHYFQQLWPEVVYKVFTKSKVIALTIDDCPSTHTLEIMEILRVNDACATFFVIGSQVPGFEETLESLVRNGNELGNHAMHDEPSRALATDELARQISAVEGLICKVYRQTYRHDPPRYFRPGSGFFNTTIRETMKRLGYRLILGSVYPHDPHIASPSINAWHILSMITAGDIVICHDRRAWTPGLLRKVLPEIGRRGYRVVTVTELLKQGVTAC